jgi:D-alanyl-D-alanine dipeptidase
VSVRVEDFAEGLWRSSALKIPPIPLSPRPGGQPGAGEDIDESAPLVIVQSGPRLAVRPYYHLHGMRGTTSKVRLRQPIIARLHEAASLIPEGLTLTVLDGWRTADTQRAIYEQFCEKARAVGEENPAKFAFDLDSDDVGLDYPASDAPHCTGGAVDVTLLGPDDQEWPMGTEFDAVSPRSATRALEIEKPAVGVAALLGRRILYHAMVGAGFRNYPEEWWHYDYGNSFWRFYGGFPTGPIFRTITRIVPLEPSPGACDDPTSS